MRHIAVTLASITLVVFIAAATAMAQSANGDVDELRQLFDDAVSKYSFRTSSNEEISRIDGPLLNWSNAQRKTPGGALFFWFGKDRPTAALCTFVSGANLFASEFQSLSLQTFTMNVDGQVTWSPAEPGLVMKPLPQLSDKQASAVGGSAPIRLRQMRMFARQFTAKLVPPNRNETLLRLMPTPVLRYPKIDPAGAVVDGAVFAFAQGTDPEVLLLIEAAADGESVLRWQYAIARMSSVSLDVFHQDQLIWQTSWNNGRNSKSPYFVIKKFDADDAKITVFD